MSPSGSPCRLAAAVHGITFLLGNVRRDVPPTIDGVMQIPTALNGLTIGLYWHLPLSLFLMQHFCPFTLVEHAKTAIDVLPERLIDGLGVAGGIMPAITLPCCSKS